MQSLLPPRSIVSNRCLHPFDLHLGLHEMLGAFDPQRTESQLATAGGFGGISDLEFSCPDSPHLRDLLVQLAKAVSRSDWERSRRLVGFLSHRTSHEGDSNERVIAHFVNSLAAKVANALGENQAMHQEYADPTEEEIQVAYLEFNRVTPFLRFSHLTANQAILEALEGSDMVHIVDLEIMQGVQWPPLMQALAGRSGGPPSCIRISGAGSDADILEQTGQRLMKFAASLHLPFEFRALHANHIEDVTHSMLDIRPGEALAVNCALESHHLWHSNNTSLTSFLSMIHSLQPKVVTLVDREANFNQPMFMDRFMEAFHHYSALFASLEATLPPTSAERRNVERVWLRREIESIMAWEDMEMQESYLNWRDLLKAEGFRSVPHSTFAVSQARLLLRLHYPSQGYQLREEDDCLLVGWQDAGLFAVSAWN